MADCSLNLQFYLCCIKEVLTYVQVILCSNSLSKLYKLVNEEKLFLCSQHKLVKIKFFFKNHRSSFPYRSVISLTFLSAVGGFLFGYDTGVVSGAMLLIEDDPEIQPNTLWKELIVSATVGAAWLFALIGGPSNEYFGRKPTILMARYISIFIYNYVGVWIYQGIRMIKRSEMRPLGVATFCDNHLPAVTTILTPILS